MNKEVIVVCYLGKKGGGALDAYEITKALVDNGNQVVAIISNFIENKVLWEKLKIEKLVSIDTYTDKFTAVSSTLLFNWKQKRIIIREMEEFRIKAVYCPMVSLWTGLIFSIFRKEKKMIAIHDPVAHSGANWIVDSYFHRVYNQADILITHSKRFVSLLRDRYNKKVLYLPLGEHDLYQHLENKKKLVSYDPDKVNFMFFGRIAPYKGLGILAEAYEHISTQYGNNVTLTVVGNGDFDPYSEKYKSLKNTTIVNRWIEDEEVESVFSGENIVCVCPYKDATQSGVVLVSYSYRIPVIASSSGGVEEQVIDNRTGFLIEPNSVSSLVLAMEKFIQQPEIFSCMRSEIDAFLHSISWKESAKKLVDFLDVDESGK